MVIKIEKRHTDLIKGVGILLIILHNFFHTVNPSTGENEFIFDVTFTENLFRMLSNSYLDTINLLFSFFGHYGVQLFIFISGYGLAKSFHSKRVVFSTFIRKRVTKLYPAFLIGIFMLICYNAIVFQSIPDLEWIKSIIYKLLMVHTLIPNEALSIVGPWWFYGIIIQLYLLFIPLYYLVNKWQFKGFLFVLALSYILIFFVYSPLLNNDIFIMANAPGHLPEFALGILLAINPKLNFKPIYYPVLLALFILGNFYFYFFPFSFIIITFLLLKIILYHFKKERIYSPVIAFYGQLSMFLFAIHGFLRNPLFAYLANEANNPFKTIGFGLLYLLFVTVIAFITRAVYEFLQKKIKTM